MRRVLSVTWFAARALYDEVFPLIGMGAIWFMVSVAVPYGAYTIGALTRSLPLTVFAVALSLIPVPPVTGALYYVAVQIAREKRIEFRYFWESARTYAGLSWKIGGLVLVSGAVLVVDVVFYLGSGTVVYTIFGLIGLWALLFWAGVQIYLFPMAFLLEEPRLRTILRNAGLLTAAYPFFALGVAIVVLLSAALGALTLGVLLATVWMPFVAILTSRAALTSLEEAKRYQERRSELERERSAGKE